MKHRSWPSSAAAASCAVIVFSFLGIAPAQADEATTDPLSALAELSDASQDPMTDVLANVADVATTATGASAIDATVGDVEVTIPNDPSEGVTLMSGTGAGVRIALPFADHASDAEVLTGGVVAYENGNSSTTVPIVKRDGSLQITTVIDDASAPSRYSYPLGLSAGGSASLQRDGGVLLLDSQGEYLASVAPAWAKDADGKDVPTHYELDGITLTQVVDHGVGVNYPVVADPWLGMELISYTSWSGNTLRVYPTDYGRWGASVARSAAWDEVKAKTPGTRENTSSMTDQFLCHYDMRPATSTKSSWNLELNRPYINYALLIANACNN